MLLGQALERRGRGRPSRWSRAMNTEPRKSAPIATIATPASSVRQRLGVEQDRPDRGRPDAQQDERGARDEQALRIIT